MESAVSTESCGATRLHICGGMDNFGRMAERSEVRVAVVGANGYTGEELCRLLPRHPHVRPVLFTSRRHAGRRLAEVFAWAEGHPVAGEWQFAGADPKLLAAADFEIAFLALPNGVAADYAAGLLEAGKRVIDISADFRLRDPAAYQEFYDAAHPAPGLLEEAVYGLPEVRRQEIRAARLVACPGCYPTSVLLPLIPLLRAGLIRREGICIASASGTSGAGRKADETLLFAECNESLRAYGIPKHRHLPEIEQELSIAAGGAVVVTFVPHLAPMTRGIHTTIFAVPAADAESGAFMECLQAAYAGEPFVHVADRLPDTKDVARSNRCHISCVPDPRAGRVILCSAEDNLVKGAGGQGIQCLNLMCGFDETEGLL